MSFCMSLEEKHDTLSNWSKEPQEHGYEKNYPDNAEATR